MTTPKFNPAAPKTNTPKRNPQTTFFKKGNPSLAAERDASLLAKEHSAVLVKVSQQSFETEATIYGEGRSRLKYQVLSPEEKEMLGDDETAFFVARWDLNEVKWVLLRRAPKGDRW